MTKVLAVISFIDKDGRPVDPGFGQGAAGPIDPDYGVGVHPHPGHDLPQMPVGTWPPRFPPDPVDPNWGAGAPRPPHPTLPIYIPDVGIDNELPPVSGIKPPTAPPPGTIWPPLPPPTDGKPPLKPGKAALLIWLIGVGWRYIVVDIPPATVEPK